MVRTYREVLGEYLRVNELVLERFKDDPLFNFKPHAGQIPFIESVLERKYVQNIAVTAYRFGKTVMGAYCGAIFARFGIDGEPVNGWVCSINERNSMNVVMPRYFDNGRSAGGIAPFIPDREIKKFYRDESLLVLKNGSTIGFLSGESKVSASRGYQIDWKHYDEEPKEELYDEHMLRIGGRFVPPVFFTCTLIPDPTNPDGGGVSWMVKRLINRASKLPGTKVFKGRMKDNPHLHPDQIKHVEAIHPPGSLMWKAAVNGEIITSLKGAQVYTNFDFNKHVKPLEPLSPYMPLCWGWDFNKNPLCTIVGQKHKGRFYVHKEYMLNDTIPNMVAMFRRDFPDHPGGIKIYGDFTGRQTSTQSGMDNYELILQLMNDYPSNIDLCIPGDGNPAVISRIDAVNYALSGFDGESRVVIDDSCEGLINDFMQVVYNSNRTIKKVTDTTKAASKLGHLSDIFGYWVCYESPVSQLIMNSTEELIEDFARPVYF